METWTDCYIDPSSSLDHSGTSFASWLVAQPWVTEGRKALSLQAGSHAGIPELDPPGHLLILFPKAHLLPLFFHLFTKVHLLIDDSVEGQYMTMVIIINLVLTVTWKLCGT